MQKSFLKTLGGLLIFTIFLSGCTDQNESNIASPKTENKIAEKKSAYEISWEVPTELIKKAWTSNVPLKKYFQNEKEIFFTQGKKIEYPDSEVLSKCMEDLDCTEEVKDHLSFQAQKNEKDVAFKYIFSEKRQNSTGDATKNVPVNLPKNFTEEYNLIQKNSKGNINEEKPITLIKDGKEIFTSVVCQGTYDQPLVHFTKVLEKLTFDFFEGLCYNENQETENKKSAYASPNIFYDGTTINQRYSVEGSYRLFDYKGKLGFIEVSQGKQYIFFNGKRLSTGYDYIRSYFNSDYIFPLFEIYDNGALIFVAHNGKDNYKNYYFVQIDLNSFVSS